MKKERGRYIPGTNPAWGRELPDKYSNSMTDKAGYPCDTGYNFDEKDDDPEDEEEDKNTGWEDMDKPQ